jgi:nucleotidyltransferase substrate binding protein (TIGR01987 family)
MKEIKIAAKHYTDALNRLIEGIEEANDGLGRDGVIQRFEFTFERFWKLLKLILQYEGFECRSPRSCIKEAFKQEIIVDSEIYLDMLEDRNRSSHVYDEKTSIEIYDRIEDQYSKELIEAESEFTEYVNDQFEESDN